MLTTSAMLRPLSLFALLALCFAPLRATSVTPPTLAQLTARAETVFRGEVLSIRSELVTRAGSRAIFTTVTFRIDELLKGALPGAATLTLEFLGGTVGELTMDVAGIPQFAVGQTDILFVEKNGAQICPLVAMMFGRYHVLRDAVTGGEFIARDSGTPLTSVAEIALPFTSSALDARLAPLRGSPLTPAAFAAFIREEALRVHTP